MSLPDNLIDEMSRQYSKAFPGYSFDGEKPAKTLDANVSQAKEKMEKKQKLGKLRVGRPVQAER